MPKEDLQSATSSAPRDSHQKFRQNRFTFSLGGIFLLVSSCGVLCAAAVSYVSYNKRNRAKAAIYQCALNSDLSGIKELLKEYPDLLKHPDPFYGSPLHAVVSSRNVSIELLDLLLEAESPNTPNRFGQNVLTAFANNPHAAWYSDSTVIAEKLILRGADVNSVDAFGWTALHHSVFTTNSDLVDILLENGASTELQESQYGFAPLHIACLVLSNDEARQLLDAGADPDRKDNLDRKPVDLIRLDLQNLTWSKKEFGSFGIITFRTNERDPERIAEREVALASVFDEYE